MKTIKFLILSIATFGLMVSCNNDDDNPTPVNEEEVITTLTSTLTPQGGGADVTLQTQDLDGDGPNPPVVTVSGPFATDTVYDANIVLLNETEVPADNITQEVEQEDEEHQFFFTLTAGVGVIDYADQDADGNPVGLNFTLSTGMNAVNGTLTVTLRHEPDKNAAGVSDGDITNAGGETDIQASFNVSTQ